MIFAMYIISAKKLQIGKKNEFLRIFATPAQGEKIKIFKFLKKIRKLWPKSTPDTYEDDQIYEVGSYWTHLLYVQAQISVLDRTKGNIHF